MDLKNTLIRNAETILTSLTTLLFGYIVIQTGSLIGVYLLPQLSKKFLAGIVGLFSIILILQFAYIYLLIKLKPVFGLLWDKSLNPYCPACKTLLSGYGHRDGYGYSFFCIKCKGLLSIQDDTGEDITLEQAKEQLL